MRKAHMATVVTIKQDDHQQALDVAINDLYAARFGENESPDQLLQRLEAVRVHCEALIGERR